jgi:hypothetical protein
MQAAIAAALVTFVAGGVVMADGEWPHGRRPLLDPPREVHTPPLMWWGSSSGVTKPSYQRITSAADWKVQWRRLAGDAVPADVSERLRPEIDFTKFVVVVVYAGTRFNRAAVIPEIIDDDKDDVQRVRLSLPLGPVRDQRECTPYVIFLLPRSDKALVLEEEEDDGARRVRARFPNLR